MSATIISSPVVERVVAAVRQICEDDDTDTAWAVDVAFHVFGASEDYEDRQHSYLVRTSHALRRAAHAGDLVCLRPRPGKGLGGTCLWALNEGDLREVTLRDYRPDGERDQDSVVAVEETPSKPADKAPLTNRQLFDGLWWYVNETVARAEHYVDAAAESRDHSGNLAADALDLDAADDGLALAARAAALLVYGEQRVRTARQKLERSDWRRW